jgi:beta-lactamase superfamily II metal-dependent hydrolase
MSDFFEIDFLDVESPKSGDAIPLRYEIGGVTTIHIVDGGFQDTGEKIIEHIKKYYGNPSYIDRVVASHPDGDHAGGLRTVLEELDVGELWMLRPWLYADEIIHRFSRFNSVENLKARLKEIYPNIAALEEIAIRKGIPIFEPFQGAAIGAFTVMTPKRARYLDLIVESDRTPESVEETEKGALAGLGTVLEKAAAKVIAFVKAAWGVEVFSAEETSAENEMSVVQYANLFGKRILLTADTGRAGLLEAADYAPYVQLSLPGIDQFQVPHHGSRRNVSSETMDHWLGPRLASKPVDGQESFTAIISSAKADEDHPRKAVVRACIHRGAKVVTTEGASLRTSHNAPNREGWSAAKPVLYPEDQEE